MASTPRQSRIMLAIGAALMVAVALIVAVGVIPPVRVTTVADISPESAVPAFWVSVGAHLVAALIIALTAVLSKRRSGISTSVLVTTGVVTLLLGFMLGDAALAFREAGRSLQTIATLLFLCVIADVAAGALTITTAFLRPKAVRRAQG